MMGEYLIRDAKVFFIRKGKEGHDCSIDIGKK